MINEYKENGYIIIDNLLPKKEYKKIVDICKNARYEEVDQVRPDRYKMWKHQMMIFSHQQTKYIKKIIFGVVQMFLIQKRFKICLINTSNH